MREDDCNELCRERDEDDLFGRNCDVCGQMPCYANDSTMVIARKTMDQNVEDIRTKLTRVSTFLQSNKLVINEGKTKAQNFMVHQRRAS